VAIVFALLAGMVMASLASPSPGTTGVAGFGDVPPTAYYATAVQWLVDHEITHGVTPTCFAPGDPASRGQVAALIWRMEGEPQPTKPSPFDDVTASWQQDPVAWMAEQGISTGTSLTSFEPDLVTSRAMVGTFLWRLAGEPPAAGSTDFADVPPDVYFATAVGWMRDEGITTGTSPTTFSPHAPATRAHIAAFLYRYQGSPAVVLDVTDSVCNPGTDLPPTTTTTTPPTTAPPLELNPRNGRAFIQDNLWRGVSHDFAAWFDDEGVPMVGRRAHGGAAWEVVNLGALPGDPMDSDQSADNHLVLAVAEDARGIVHVLGNSHGGPLAYVRTAGPGDFTSWEEASIAGPSDDVTYPRIVARNDGTLLLFRRDGVPGNGDTLLDELVAGATEWSHVGVVFDGRATGESPYLHRIVHDPADDSIHVLLMWRSTADPSTNNDIGYATSLDGGRTWTTIDGTPLPTPVRHDALLTVIDTAPTGSGIINQGGFALGPDGTPHALVKTTVWGLTMHVWHDGTDWATEWLNVITSGRPAVVVLDDGSVWFLALDLDNWVIAGEIDATADETRRIAPASDGWEVAIDSRSHDHNSTVRMLMPIDESPSVVSFTP
jgi:hypothetical protein